MKDELAAHGANRSLIHIDWMIGSGETDVDGVSADGREEPVMRRWRVGGLRPSAAQQEQPACLRFPYENGHAQNSQQRAL